MIYTGPIKRPGILSVGIIPRRVYASNLHPIARARIDAIYAAGGSCPVGAGTAKRLLSDFILAEGSRFGGALKRIHLPGFGNAGANSIDLVTGASGSFPVAGGVTHGLGIVQGNGTTGYFDFGVTPSALGLTLGSGSLSALCKQAASTGGKVIVSAIDGNDTNKISEISHQNSLVAFRYATTTLGSGAVQANVAQASQTGILIGSREGGARRIHQRKNAGFTTPINTTGADFGTIPVTGTLQAMRSSFGGGAAYSDGQYGCFCAGLGLTTAEAEAFSANLKTLWEGLFQLSLP